MNAQAAMEAVESNQAFADCWRGIVAPMRGSQCVRLPGLQAIWGDTALPFCNSLLLSTPVRNRADLETRMSAASTFLRGRTKPPMLLLCHGMVPEFLRFDMQTIVARIGLHASVPLTGMVTENLLAPVRPLPRLRFEHVLSHPAQLQISDINSIAYGFPVELGRESFLGDPIWRRPDVFGYVAHFDGEPVASAATFVQGSILYVGFVATLPAFERRGYAEAVMRHSLAEAGRASGLRRSVLHATDAGHPIYLRMGYRETTRFMGYLAAH